VSNFFLNAFHVQKSVDTKVFQQIIMIGSTQYLGRGNSMDLFGLAASRKIGLLRGKDATFSQVFNQQEAFTVDDESVVHDGGNNLSANIVNMAGRNHVDSLDANVRGKKNAKMWSSTNTLTADVLVSYHDKTQKPSMTLSYCSTTTPGNSTYSKISSKLQSKAPPRSLS
jgi:hypothetical protein